MMIQLIPTINPIPLPSHGGPMRRVTWQLWYNHSLIQTEHSRVDWREPTHDLKPPYAIAALRDSLLASHAPTPETQKLADALDVHIRGIEAGSNAMLRIKGLREISAALRAPEAGEAKPVAHKVMTDEEYAALRINGWHMVCKDYDGENGCTAIRYIAAPVSADAGLSGVATYTDLTQVLSDIYNELGCEHDNEAALVAIAKLKSLKPVAVVVEQLEDNEARVRWLFNPVPDGAELSWEHE